MVGKEVVNVTNPDNLSPLDLARLNIQATYGGFLPKDIVDFWIDRASTWEPQYTPQSLEQWFTRIGHVPDKKYDRKRIKPNDKDGNPKTSQQINLEAAQEYLKQIEPWVLGDLETSTDLITSTYSSEIAGELILKPKESLNPSEIPAIIGSINQITQNHRLEEAAMGIATLFADATYRTKYSREKIEATLPTMIGAIARRNYNQRLLRLVSKIEKAKELNQTEVIANLEKELTLMSSPQKKEDFLVRSVRSQSKYYQRLLNQVNLSPLAIKMERMNHKASRRLKHHFPEVEQVIKRDDNTFLRVDIDLVKVGSFSWLQPSVVEDPNSNPNADKGVTLILMRTNPDTLEPEYYMCFTKRDSLDPNHSLTASHQTSWGRAQNPELNPLWQQLKDAMNGSSSTLFSPKTGVLYNADGMPLAAIAHQNPNGNRYKESRTAHVVVNLDAMPEIKRTSIPKSITSKEKVGDREVPTHMWLTAEQINLVASKGLPDIHDETNRNAAINSFARSTIQGAQAMIQEIRTNIIVDRLKWAGFSDQIIKDFLEGKSLKLESPTEAQINTVDWVFFVLMQTALNGARNRITSPSETSRLE